MNFRWPVTEEQLLAIASAGGTRKVSRAAQSIAKLMPQLTHDQYDEFWRWAIIEELSKVQSVDQRMRLEFGVGFRQLRTCRRPLPGQLCANKGIDSITIRPLRRQGS